MSSQYPQVQTRPLPPRPAASAMAPAVDRRARLVLRRLDPWSVLKFSVVFYFCLMLISLLVFAFIWLLGVVVWSIVTVLLTLLFNLVNDVTGGIEVVLAEREQRPPGS